MCVYTCVYIYIYIHIHICIHIYIYIYTYSQAKAAALLTELFIITCARRGCEEDTAWRRYCTVLYCTVLYCTVLYYTILYYTTIRYDTIRYIHMTYSTILYYTIPGTSFQKHVRFADLSSRDTPIAAASFASLIWQTEALLHSLKHQFTSTGAVHWSTNSKANRCASLIYRVTMHQFTKSWQCRSCSDKTIHRLLVVAYDKQSLKRAKRGEAPCWLYSVHMCL